jgi:NAD(P)-dependent dehydrogenase (short-subunit alcohol dehydrogenase family)
MAAIAGILNHKWIDTPKESIESFEGRTVLVTGATSGIGHAAAAKFAKLGASKVIIPARDVSKGEKTKIQLEIAVGNKEQFVVWQLDMNSYDSVVAFAHRINTEVEHLDVAILNAGVRKIAYTPSKYGWEEDLQVNTLSTMLLGILLLPKLKGSQILSRKIPILQFVNSGLHQNAIVHPDFRKASSILAEYNKPESFSAQKQYVHSKLLLMFAAKQLAARISPSDVIITSVCPGMVASNLARDIKFPGISVALAIMRYTVQRTAEQGANTYVSGAAQNKELHGNFWQHDEIQPQGKSLVGNENEALAMRVWNEIVEELGKRVPQLGRIIEGSC